MSVMIARNVSGSLTGTPPLASPVCVRTLDSAVHRLSINYGRENLCLQYLLRWDPHDVLGEHHIICALPLCDGSENVLRERRIGRIPSHACAKAFVSIPSAQKQIPGAALQRKKVSYL